MNLKLCLATATHNFIWVTITHIDLILDHSQGSLIIWLFKSSQKAPNLDHLGL